jgi:NAD(P)-dependent dehydrogenase (short-subunit alcohol dehydrogenase family)
MTMQGLGRLRGKVAIVTGAAQGIGRGIAHLFAAEGARVIITDIQEERGAQTAAEIVQKGGEALFLAADAGEEQDWVRVIEETRRRYGRLDALVNNAHRSRSDRATDTSMEDWAQAMKMTVTAGFLGCKHAIPLMIESGGGAIVNISSVHGLLPARRSLGYETGKAGLIMLTKQVALDYGPSGIRCNAICPGAVHHERALERRQRDPEAYERNLRFTESFYPLRRVGTPEDIARAALFLVSEESSWITGQAIAVDGGLTLQLQDSLAYQVREWVQGSTG